MKVQSYAVTLSFIACFSTFIAWIPTLYIYIYIMVARLYSFLLLLSKTLHRQSEGIFIHLHAVQFNVWALLIHYASRTQISIGGVQDQAFLKKKQSSNFSDRTSSRKFVCYVICLNLSLLIDGHYTMRCISLFTGPVCSYTCVYVYLLLMAILILSTHVPLKIMSIF